MENTYLTLQQHTEYAKRVDAEDERQNKRLEILEESIREIRDLTVSVSKMAVNMENMLTVIKRQEESIKRYGERLERIEREPGDAHKQLKATIMTAIVGAIVGGIFTAIFTIL